MKVTRSMVHADLQPFFNRVSRFETLIKHRWLTTLANKLLKGLLVSGCWTIKKAMLFWYRSIDL